MILSQVKSWRHGGRSSRRAFPMLCCTVLYSLKENGRHRAASAPLRPICTKLAQFCCFFLLEAADNGQGAQTEPLLAPVGHFGCWFLVSARRRRRPSIFVLIFSVAAPAATFSCCTDPILTLFLLGTSYHWKSAQFELLHAVFGWLIVEVRSFL